ncbi:MAG: hypothetical protein AUK34_03430 [Ignavibacteria bacterium CG2_30_36_16]|nr:DUF169 domain-containing protein [Ignavibacteria bacterium]OIP62347.1 MAG: hypothetical protein AUK34_03430 [Ignavibacteria bacterium CG2_30_36_16]
MNNNYEILEETLKEAVGLEYEPVGIKFYEKALLNGIQKAEDHRMCQLVMRARKGETLVLTKEGISCPAAAAAIGFKPLPKNLQDGSMLQGYGIFRDKEAAVKVMEDMPRLEQGKYEAVVAKPLKDWEEKPDLIVIEDEVEKLMWIALAYLNEEGGRLNMSTSILQAVCVDSIVLPFKSQKINMSFGCYGCRDATDTKPNEAILGIPFSKLGMTIENIKYLKSKAIDRSRAKQVYQAFSKRDEETVK